MDVRRNIQMLPAPLELARVETGAVQFGDDWPGLFIRGDNAISLKLKIRKLMTILNDHADPDVSDNLDLLAQYAALIDRDVRVHN